MFVVDAAGQFLMTSSAMIDRPGTMVVGDDLRDILLNVGLSEVCDIVARDSRTDLEEALPTGIVTFGRAALTQDLRERMIWYCAGLESILLKNSSEAILQARPLGGQHASGRGRQSRPLARSCSSAAAQSSISRRRASDGSFAARNLCSAINRSGVDCTF